MKKIVDNEINIAYNVNQIRQTDALKEREENQMSKFTGSQSIEVRCNNQRETEKVFDYLVANCKLNGGEWDIYESRPNVICGCETVTGYYEPEVRYTRNGDGYPGGTFIEDGIDDGWLEDEIKDRLGIEVYVDCEID